MHRELITQDWDATRAVLDHPAAYIRPLVGGKCAIANQRFLVLFTEVVIEPVIIENIRHDEESRLYQRIEAGDALNALYIQGAQRYIFLQITPYWRALVICHSTLA